ncbi:MAG: hypothetical protein R3D33_10185 [Hyphomicrobiaceae bacterium]
MPRRCYLRPLTERRTPPRHGSADTPATCGLAGSDLVGFSAMELLIRRDDGGISVSKLSCDTFESQDWGHPPFDHEEIWRTYERLCCDALSRPPAKFAGLPPGRPALVGRLDVPGVAATLDPRVCLAEAATLVAGGADALILDGPIGAALTVLPLCRAEGYAPICVTAADIGEIGLAVAAEVEIVRIGVALAGEKGALAELVAAGGCLVLHDDAAASALATSERTLRPLLDGFDRFEAAIGHLEAAGLAADRIALDPGFYPAATGLLDRLAILHGLGARLCARLGPAADQQPRADEVAIAAGQAAQLLLTPDPAFVRFALEHWASEAPS